MQIKRARTSQIVPIRILDTTSVTGGGKTGLTNASVNLTAYYHRELDTTATAISLVSTTSGVYLSGGFVESDATHLAGQYELSIPNTAIGSGDASTWVEVVLYDSGSGLGIAPSVLRLDLVAYDPQDATRLGLTALPNANAGATGGLPTRDSNGNVASAPDWSHVTNPTTTVDLSGTTIKNVDNAIATVTNLTNAPTTGDFTATMKTSLNASTPASITGAVGSVTGNVGGNVVGSVGSVIATVAANLTQILGTALTETAGQLAAGFKKWFNVAAPTSTMNEITLVDTTTNLTNGSGGTTTAFSGAAATEIDAIKTKTDTIGSATLTFNSPSITGGTEPLVTNRSYKNAYGNAITFTVSNLSVSLLAAGITTSLRMTGAGGVITQAFAGVATSATAGYVEIDMEDTEDWPAGQYQTEFVVLDGTDEIHIVSGTIDVALGVGS